MGAVMLTRHRYFSNVPAIMKINQFSSDLQLELQLQAKDVTIKTLSTEVKDLKARVVHLESAIQSLKEPSEEDLLVEKPDGPPSLSKENRYSNDTSNVDNARKDKHVAMPGNELFNLS